MRVRFIKETPERYRLECVREDDSTTVASLEFRGYFKHDLMHLVVERAAGLQESFFGMVQAGRDLSALTPKAIRESAATFPEEIQTTETIVSALQSLAKSEADLQAACERIREYLAMMGMAEPEYLTPEFCTQAIAEHRSLVGRWGQLHGGEWLEFSFP
ncbi:MAG: hypothetical protein JNJ50_22020 [Acidobacteria bacterium]|nr:hypothetical protein [Acidobacteriota bacterium]